MSCIVIYIGGCGVSAVRAISGMFELFVTVAFGTARIIPHGVNSATDQPMQFIHYYKYLVELSSAYNEESLFKFNKLRQ